MRTFERDRLHVLERNPNYRGGTYPCEGQPEDKAAGLLDDCGKATPFVDRLYVTIEKERTPRKEKFKQGYLDVPEIERPEWGVDFKADSDDSDEVRRLFDERKFKFPLTADISNWYLGFNMLDPVVGNVGTPQRARAPSQAAPGDLDRHRLGRGLRPHLSLQGRRCRARPVAAGPVWLARADAGLLQPGDAPSGRRQGRAPPDRRRQAAAGRGRLPRRPRRSHRPAAGAELRLPARDDAGVQGRERLDGQAVRQDRHPARDPRHRLQPVPGQDAQGQAPDLLGRLAGRLSRRRELLVPAVRAQRQEQEQRREHRQLREPALRRAVSRAADARRHAAQAAGDRRDGGAGAARCAVVVRLHLVGRPGVPAMGLQRQAEHPDPRHGAVLPGRPGAACAHAGRVEPADRLAARAAADGAAGRAAVGLAQLARARAGHRTPARRRQPAECRARPR